MMDWFTVKQWLFLFFAEHAVLGFYFYKMYNMVKCLMADNVTLGRMIKGDN